MAARVIQVKVQPGARRTELSWQGPDQCRAKLTAPPVDGKANEALIELLAEELGVRRSAVTIIRGQAARTKIVKIE